MYSAASKMAEYVTIELLTQNGDSHTFESIVKRKNTSAQESLQQRNVTSSVGESMQKPI